MIKIKNLLGVFILLCTLQGCSNDPIRLELIQNPLEVGLRFLPNFRGEFVEDRPVDVVISIDSFRVELTTYNVRVLDVVTRTPIHFIEEPYPGSAKWLVVTLPPMKAGRYSVITTITDINNFQSAAEVNLEIPPVAFQDEFDDIWYKGTSNQWQNNIKFDQVDNHVWQASCVSLGPGQAFILTSNPSGTDCYWGEDAVIDQVGTPITLPITCDSVNYVYASQRPLRSEVPAGQYSILFDDVTNELTLLPNDGCFVDLGRSPMKIQGTAVTSHSLGADYFKITNQNDQLVMYFENGTFELLENDGSGTTWGGLGSDGQLTAGGTPISINEGLYHLVLDDELKQLTITSIEEIAIIGDPDWTLDRPLEQDPLNPWIWKGTGLTLETGDFRFRANQNWDLSWGDPELDILLNYGGGNIAVSGGTYDITINVLANNYLIE